MSRFELPAGEHAALATRVRERLRARMNATRRALPKPALAARSQLITERLLALPWLREARSVASFWPLLERGEVDLRALDAQLESRGVARFYPFMTPTERGFTTGFRRISSAAELVRRQQTFCEPPPEAEAATAGAVDLVLVPALAVTPSGHRLGFGSGFYDVTLPEFCPPARSLCVAFSFQVVPELPCEPHDVACDAVLTDTAWYEPGSEPSR